MLSYDASNLFQIAEEFREKSIQWITSVCGTEYKVPTGLSTPEMVEFVCQKELLLSARFPYRDCSKAVKMS